MKSNRTTSLLETMATDEPAQWKGIRKGAWKDHLQSMQRGTEHPDGETTWREHGIMLIQWKELGLTQHGFIFGKYGITKRKDFQVTDALYQKLTAPVKQTAKGNTRLIGRQIGLSLSTLWCCAVVFLRLLYTKQVEF